MVHPNTHSEDKEKGFSCTRVNKHSPVPLYSKLPQLFALVNDDPLGIRNHVYLRVIIACCSALEKRKLPVPFCETKEKGGQIKTETYLPYTRHYRSWLIHLIALVVFQRHNLKAH